MRRKILLSFIVVAAMLVLIVGATYAVFSDQVMSDVQSFNTGTVDINVNGSETTFSTTLHMEGVWAPGDKKSQPITINNTGNLDVMYMIYVDYTYGEQPDLWRCDPPNSMQAWAETSYGDGIGFIEAGDYSTAVLYAELPLAAGNECQNKSGDMRVTVHAVQKSNLHPDEFTCVKLVYKDQASQWLPYGPEILDSGNWKGQHGNLCYETDDDGDLRVIVNAYGLTPGAYYQLALNGQGGCDNPESNIFATLGDDLYHSGWSGGSTTALSPSCTTAWAEGVYNFYGTDGQVQADSNGNFSLDYTIDGSNPHGDPLPAGTYEDVKFIVKEITSSEPPTHENHGSNWQPMLMEIRALNFTTGP